MAASANDSICFEKQLLVCCARTHVDARVAAEIRRLLAVPLDWDFLLAEAGSHSVTPLLLRHLWAIAPESVPAPQLARLKDRVRATTVHSLVLTAELIRILEAMASAGVAAIPYKGPVVAIQAYGDLALREFEDIDLVLRQSDIVRANEVLASLGFSPQFPPIFAPSARSSLIPGEYDYRDRERHLTIELHTEGTLRHFPVTPNLDQIERHLATVSLSGHEVRTFSPEDTLVFLCVHGAKDFWERLIWIADVAEFVGSHPRLDWAGVYALADSVRARRMLHLGLALASGLFGISMPEEIRSRVRTDDIAVSFAARIQRSLLSRSATPQGARATFSYRRKLVPGALSGFRYATRLATAPAAEDWHSMRLPRPLAPLYAALRPFRLLRKYGASHRTAAAPPP